jgi:Fe-S cluster assembly protein SufD
MKEQKLLLDSQEHPLILQQRRRAWDAFLSLDKSPLLPTDTFKRAENKQFTKEEILAFIPENSRTSAIVFVNGWFCHELSDISALKKCLLLPSKDAANSFASLVLSKTALEEQDHITLLNTSMHQAGAFLYIPPKSVFREPLFILSIIAANTLEWVMPKLQLFVGASSDIKIQRSAKYLSGSSCLYNSNIDVTVEERALVQVIADDFATLDFATLDFATLDFATLGVTGWYFDTLSALQKSHSSFSHLQLATNSRSYNIKVALAGEYAEACLSGLSLLAKEQKVSTKYQVKHLAPFCRSMQLYKNVLSDASQADFQGKIFVARPAQKTESYQLNRSLLLSDLATSTSQPNLEIFADDVKASHGSTCGQLDSEELFYLTSRGIGSKEARKMLLTGFTQEITQKSFSEEQKANFLNILARYEDS